MSIFSLEFIAFILIILSLYFAIPRRYQWYLLLLVSYIFYGMSGWCTLPYIMVTTAVTYVAAIVIERRQKQCKERISALGSGASKEDKNALKKQCTSDKKWYLLLALLITFGYLVYFKYLNTLLAGLCTLFHAATLEPFKLIVPLGISFYTFQSAGYLIDVYRGKVPAERNLLKFALFISYFPQIIQGPISRFQDLSGQLFSAHSFDYTRVKFGLQRMLWGYFQKLVIADRLAILVNEIFDNYAEKGYSGFIVFTGAFLYSIQIYCDFCGGMDIISGLSECFGIRLPLNFKQPLCARSVAEFWQRWHITLGFWLKNYLFYPLAMSKTFTQMGKFLRKHVGNYAGKILPTCLASFITFFLIGIWHGASLKYVFYGFYQATFVSTATLLEPFYEKCRGLLHLKPETWYMNAFQTTRTILLITIGRYFSRADSFSTAVDMLRKTCSTWNPEVLFDGTLRRIGQALYLDTAYMILSILLIISLFVLDCARNRGFSPRLWLARQPFAIRSAIYLASIFSILLCGVYGPDAAENTFIYQGF